MDKTIYLAQMIKNGEFDSPYNKIYTDPESFCDVVDDFLAKCNAAGMGDLLTLRLKFCFPATAVDYFRNHCQLWDFIEIKNNIRSFATINASWEDGGLTGPLTASIHEGGGINLARVGESEQTWSNCPIAGELFLYWYCMEEE